MVTFFWVAFPICFVGSAAFTAGFLADCVTPGFSLCWSAKTLACVAVPKTDTDNKVMNKLFL